MVVFGAAWLKKTRNINWCPRTDALVDLLCSFALDFAFWLLLLCGCAGTKRLNLAAGLFLFMRTPGSKADGLSYSHWLSDVLLWHIFVLALKRKNVRLFLSRAKRLLVPIFVYLAPSSASIFSDLELRVAPPAGVALGANDRAAPAVQAGEDATLLQTVQLDASPTNTHRH